MDEKEPDSGALIPLVLQFMNKDLPDGEKRAFTLGLLRGLADRGK
jgi:hypothetical protein